MKFKKYTFVLLTCILTMSVIVGCGKKKDTVGDNLINENPNELTGDISAIASGASGESDINTDILSNTLNNSSVSDNESISDNASSDDNISGNTANISDNSASVISSDDSKTTAITNNVSSETIDYIIEESLNSNNIVFGNISGLDIEKLYITFNTGSVTSLEVLGTEDLKDGTYFSYALTDTDSLKNTDKLVLSVSVETSDKQTISFGDLEIIDASGMNILLSHSKDGYFMYLE